MLASVPCRWVWRVPAGAYGFGHCAPGRPAVGSRREPRVQLAGHQCWQKALQILLSQYHGKDAGDYQGLAGCSGSRDQNTSGMASGGRHTPVKSAKREAVAQVTLPRACIDLASPILESSPAPAC